MRGAQQRRLTGRMERIREEQKLFDQFGLLGRQHARLTAAVRLAGECNTSADNGSKSRDRCPKSLAIFLGVCRSWRSRRPLLTERQIAAQYRHARRLNLKTAVGRSDV